MVASKRPRTLESKECNCELNIAQARPSDGLHRPQLLSWWMWSARLKLEIAGDLTVFNSNNFHRKATFKQTSVPRWYLAIFYRCTYACSQLLSSYLASRLVDFDNQRPLTLCDRLDQCLCASVYKKYGTMIAIIIIIFWGNFLKYMRVGDQKHILLEWPYILYLLYTSIIHQCYRL